MTLEEMEKTFCNRGWMGQEEAVIAVQLMPKLLKVVEAAKLWLISADIYSQHRLSSDRTVYKVDYMQGREIFRAALVELEQL